MSKFTRRRWQTPMRSQFLEVRTRNLKSSAWYRLVNVKKLRERLGLTQEAFAAAYRIPVGTLRDWEQGRKNPDAPARAYLLVIDRNPEMVAQLLKRAA